MMWFATTRRITNRGDRYSRRVLKFSAGNAEALSISWSLDHTVRERWSAHDVLLDWYNVTSLMIIVNEIQENNMELLQYCSR